LIYNAKRWLHVFQGRIYSILSHKVNYTVITNGKAATAAISTPDWRPKDFSIFNCKTRGEISEKSRFCFTNDNYVWREVCGLYPSLPSVLITFRQYTLSAQQRPFAMLFQAANGKSFLLQNVNFSRKGVLFTHSFRVELSRLIKALDQGLSQIPCIMMR
jgi:hypothetical protein